MANPISAVAEIAIGIGAGEAIKDTVTPRLQSFANDQWTAHPDKPLTAGDVAAAIAEQVQSGYASAGEAANSGVNGDRLALLTELQRKAPDIAVLLNLWRRGFIDEGAVDHGLNKAKLPAEWHQPIKNTRHLTLDPAVLAVAIQRGIIPDPGILPVGPPTVSGKVPAFPVFPVDAVAEAEASGIDKTHLSVMVGNVGLPLSLEAAASAYFRGIIELADFQRAVAEGNTRNEWGAAALEQARPIPHPLDGVQGHLRGWLTQQEMYDEAARSGMRPADVDLLFKIHGRPLSWHQVFIGLRRGGTYDGPTDIIDPAFLKALRESDIRPEWYNLAWHSRFTYPTAFVLRSLTQAGDITQAEAEQILLYEGWEPTLAAQVSTKWAGGGAVAGGASSDVKKAQTSLFTATHRSYVNAESGDPEARAALSTLKVSSADQDEILRLWTAERALIHAQLTPTQIRKAVKGAVINPATGVAWTHADAMAALLARGYDQADATTFLAE